MPTRVLLTHLVAAHRKLLDARDGRDYGTKDVGPRAEGNEQDALKHKYYEHNSKLDTLSHAEISIRRACSPR